MDKWRDFEDVRKVALYVQHVRGSDRYILYGTFFGEEAMLQAEREAAIQNVELNCRILETLYKASESDTNHNYTVNVVMKEESIQELRIKHGTL